MGIKFSPSLSRSPSCNLSAAMHRFTLTQSLFPRHCSMKPFPDPVLPCFRSMKPAVGSLQARIPSGQQSPSLRRGNMVKSHSHDAAVPAPPKDAEVSGAGGVVCGGQRQGAGLSEKLRRKCDGKGAWEVIKDTVFSIW